MEADIAGATVRNALAQGCERVYLVDNASSDDTVAAACAEGAILARSFRTESYDEGLRLRHMNEVVREVSEAEPGRRFWWLFMDGDEFHHGPFGMTLFDYLSTLDVRFRVVGARFFNHYPGNPPHYVPGSHPLDFQPLCEEVSYPMCPRGHRKHPLIQFDKDGPAINVSKGFHLVHCAEPLYEPQQPCFLRSARKALHARDWNCSGRAILPGVLGLRNRLRRRPCRTGPSRPFIPNGGLRS